MAARRPTTDPGLLASTVARWTPHGYAYSISGGRFEVYRHVEYIGHAINEAVRRGGARLIINLPPRHSKSELVSAYTPAWFLDHWPDKSVMLCSYSGELASDFGRRIRNEVNNNRAIRFSLREDSKAADRWHTNEGGSMVTAGVGGSITGRGFDLGLIDDSLKNWQDAYSARVRRSQIEWFRSTFYTRAEPGASIVIVNTRWHPSDLCGWLIEDHEDDWTVIRLPAIAEPGDPIGRAPGDPLCPERYTLSALEQIRDSLGPIMWEAIYQQRPSGVASGRIYDRFDDGHLDKTLALRGDQPVSVAVDWNLNPGMHVEVGWHDPKVDQFSVVHEIHAPRMGIDAAAKEVVTLLNREAAKATVLLYGDATGRSMEQGAAYSALFRRHLIAAGFKVSDRIPTGNPPVIARVLAVQDALLSPLTGKRSIRVHPRCARLVNDLRVVQTDEDGQPAKDSPDLTHASDCLGYWVHSVRPIRLTPPGGSPTKARYGVARAR